LKLFGIKKLNILRENVSDNAADQDTFEGRLVNPGHTIEACWFLMDIARKRNIPDIIDKASLIMLKTIEFGWDNKYGGIFYFMDIKGKPPQQLEWDQKLWWVHMETLVGTSLAYSLLPDTSPLKNQLLQWYLKVHEYSWSHFADPKHGEWFGYLNRSGDILLQLKGGKWKGCFHVPRGLLLCYQIFQALDL